MPWTIKILTKRGGIAKNEVVIRNNIDLSLKELSPRFSPLTPYRLIYRTFPRFSEVRLHYHDSLEFNIYHAMEGRVFLNGREYALEDHSLLVLPPGTLHSYVIPAQPGQMVVLQLSFTDLNRHINTEETARALGLEWDRVPFFTERSEVPRLCYELMEKGEGDYADFLIWVIRLFKAMAFLENPRNINLPPAGELSWLRRTIAHTEASFHRKLSLKEAASAVGFSPSYFSRLFKKRTGLNFKDYLLSVRLGRADELLAQGAGVTETAELCGFQDLSYFIKVYRENRGASPGAGRFRKD